VTLSHALSPPRSVSAQTTSLFARLISHQPAVLFSQNEPATSNQPQPASSTLLSEQTSTSHQPPANRTRCTLATINRDPFSTKYPIVWVAIINRDPTIYKIPPVLDRDPPVLGSSLCPLRRRPPPAVPTVRRLRLLERHLRCRHVPSNRHQPHGRASVTTCINGCWA
jgi:hypothetical protein